MEGSSYAASTRCGVGRPWRRVVRVLVAGRISERGELAPARRGTAGRGGRRGSRGERGARRGTAGRGGRQGSRGERGVRGARRGSRGSIDAVISYLRGRGQSEGTSREDRPELRQELQHQDLMTLRHVAPLATPLTPPKKRRLNRTPAVVAAEAAEAVEVAEAAEAVEVAEAAEAVEVAEAVEAVEVAEAAEVVVAVEAAEATEAADPLWAGSPLSPPSPGLYMECKESPTTPPTASVSIDRCKSPAARRRLEPQLTRSSSPQPGPSAAARPRRHLVKNEEILAHVPAQDSEDDDSGDEERLPFDPHRERRTVWRWDSDSSDDETILPAPAVDPAVAAATDAQQCRPLGFFHFEWTDFPEQYVPPQDRREIFSVRAGPTTEASDPYEVFCLIWDRDIMERIVRETNQYAQQCIDSLRATGRWTRNCRMADWKNTNLDELYVYLALVLSMGLVVKERICDYWSKRNDITMTLGFGMYMPLRRFQLLNKCLHFNDNSQMPKGDVDPRARLFKVQPVLDHLSAKFETLYICGQDVSLDESLLQWMGPLEIKQYIPHKAAVAGIKSYEVCDSKTGYMWRFIIHIKGMASPNPNDPLTASVPSIVLQLVKGLEYKGYTLWMDNYYNSPALARKLKSIGFDCAGTLRTNCQFIPKELATLEKKDMVQGHVVGLTSGDVDVVVWRDKNRVATLSTYHGNGVAIVGGVGKPTVIRDYNVCMGGVDKKDQMLAMHSIERKRTKVWYKKLFRRLVNVSVLNAFVIHKHNAKLALTHREFRHALVNSLLGIHYRSPVPEIPKIPKIPKILNPNPNLPMHPHFHHPKDYPFLANNRKNRQRKRCVVCRKGVSTYCPGCNKCVCARECFVTLHPL